jgi:hypothetical protein
MVGLGGHLVLAIGGGRGLGARMQTSLRLAARLLSSMMRESHRMEASPRKEEVRARGGMVAAATRKISRVTRRVFGQRKVSGYISHCESVPSAFASARAAALMVNSRSLSGAQPV